MENVKLALKTHDVHTPKQVHTGKVPIIIGCQKIRFHIVFDVKMYFTRKAQFVAGRHMTKPP